MEITEELRMEWIEKVSIPKREDAWTQGAYPQRFTVNTPLYSAPQEIKEDRGVVEAAALQGEEYFWNFDKKFSTDENFIQFLIDNKYKKNIYLYLGYQLRDKEDLFRQCVLRGEQVIEYGKLPRAIIENKELVLELLPFSNFYKGLDDHYKLDKEVLSVYMLKHNPHYFSELSKRMFNHFSKNKPFLIELLAKNGSAYSHIDVKLKEDLDIIHALLSGSPDNARYLPKELTSDKAFMMYSMEKYGLRLTNAGENLRNDLDLVSLSIKKNGEDLFLSTEHRESPKLLEISMETCPVLSKVPNGAWKNIDLIIKYLKKHDPTFNTDTYSSFKKETNFSFFLDKILPTLERDDPKTHKEYINNKEIIRLVIENDLNGLKLFTSWKEDKELANLAFAKNPCIEYLHQSELSDKKFMLELFQKHPSLIQPLHSYTNLYTNDYDFLIPLLKKNHNYIKHSAKGKNDKQIVQFLLDETQLTDISLIDSSLWTDNDIALQFIQKDVENYKYLPLRIKQNSEVIDCIASSKVKQAANLYQVFVDHSGLENDLNFHKRITIKNHEFYEQINKHSPLKNNFDLILIYLNSLVDYENTTNRKLVTKLPEDVLVKYKIENGSPGHLKANLFRDLLENQLADKSESKLNRKVKL